MLPVVCSMRGFAESAFSLIHCVRYNDMGDVIASAVLEWLWAIQHTRVVGIKRDV